MKNAMVLVLVLFSVGSRADLISEFSLDAKPIRVVAADGAIIKGHQYLNTSGKPNSGPPILLVHGFTSNEYAFYLYVNKLMREGYNVFTMNLRGHGNRLGPRNYVDGEKSVLPQYYEGGYRVENMIRYDLPAFSDFVLSQAHRPPTIIGHSLGGMVAKASDAMGFLKGKVEKIVAIGSPPHLRGLPAFMRALSRWNGNFLENLTPQFMLPTRGTRGAQPRTWLQSAYNLRNRALSLGAEFFVMPVMAAVIKHSVIAENYEPFRLSQIGALAFSDFHVDTAKSFATFTRSSDYPWEGLPLNVPYLAISALQDGLAPDKDVVEDAFKVGSRNGVTIIRLHGASHLDMATARRVVDSYFPMLLEWLENPSGNMKGQTYNVKAAPIRLFERCLMLLSPA